MLQPTPKLGDGPHGRESCMVFELPRDNLDELVHVWLEEVGLDDPASAR